MKKLLLLTLAWCGPVFLALADQPALKVSAAASLADVLKEVHAGFEKEQNCKVQLNLAGSNALARQIEAGAPADVFFSADSAQMDKLQHLGLVDIPTRKNQLSNSLVIVGAFDSQLEIRKANDLASNRVRRLAVGDPKSVPVGVYARKWLTSLQLWPQVEGKIVATDNVRAALAAVESGNVEIGIVYKTDAAISDKIKILFDVPDAESPAIVYPVARLKESAQPELALQYLSYLDSKTAGSVFQKYGFKVLKGTAKAD